MAERVQATREPDGQTRLTPREEPQLGELVRQLAQDSATLVRQEVALAKAELRENVKGLMRDAAMVGFGAAVALLGVLLLAAFLALLVGDALDEHWMGALIVGAVFVAVGGVLAKKALGNLKQDGLTPDQTIATLKEDKQWLQSEMKQVRRD
jgi:uncharacterized membrane protein YqjE